MLYKKFYHWTIDPGHNINFWFVKDLCYGILQGKFISLSIFAKSDDRFRPQHHFSVNLRPM